MKAIGFNGSPRKGWNTHKLVEAALEGAQTAGAQTELVHLHDMQFSGCMSCFACKRIGNTTNGVCAWNDALRPVLQRCMDADVLILGAPIYLGDVTAAVRALYERLIFAVLNYKLDNNGNICRTLPKAKRTALILTGNIPEQDLDTYHYTTRFNDMADMTGRMLGSCELMFVCDTCQFDDYAKYDVHLFDPVHKKERMEKHFPLELQKAKELGARLARG